MGINDGNKRYVVLSADIHCFYFSAHLDVAFSRQDFSNGDGLDELHETWKETHIPNNIIQPPVELFF